MKARILDPQVKVYSSPEPNSVSLATLPQGTEIEFSAPRRKAGKVWVPITLSTGQQAFIPGDTRIYIYRLASLLQKDVEMRAEPSQKSLVKQTLTRNAKVYILEVIKQDDQEWVRVRDTSGNEGFIPGQTRIRVIPEKTKALGRKNMLSGALWLIAGIVITVASMSPTSGGGMYIFAWGAILLIQGVVQYLTAPS
jgi:Bacterial SH3 domain